MQKLKTFNSKQLKVFMKINKKVKKIKIKGFRARDFKWKAKTY